MHGTDVVRRVAAGGIVLCVTATAIRAQWPPQRLTNLQVLPSDMSPDELVGMMGEFTRALGVRCVYCHVGEENKPLSTYRFAADDKPAKRKARVMIRMVNDLNGRYLPELEARAVPPARIECETCHRGDLVPRRLKDVILDADRSGGVDSAVARYRSLRQRYYGRATFDFGSVPLADVATEVAGHGRLADAVVLNALNVEMNPESEFARRQYVSSALQMSFREDSADSAVALYRTLKGRYGPTTFPEFMLNRIGYDLLGSGRTRAAVVAFELNVEAFPNSSNALDSLGDAYSKEGDRARAIASYSKALEIDPQAVETRKKLDALH